jgi:hypothetical protein
MSTSNDNNELWEAVMSRIDMLEAKIDAFDEKLRMIAMQGVDKKQKNALRRQFYREKKAEREFGKLSLPVFHVVTGRRDRRLTQKTQEWSRYGIEFGKQDRAEAFLSWLVFAWNNDVYLKKPITFSGSCFCVWNGSCRHKIGTGDLMHYYRKRIKLVPFLRSCEEECDFRNRPWWDWGVNVLRPVVSEMKEHEEWDDFSDQFKLKVQLLVGGTAEMKVGECNWDFCAGMDQVNKMVRRVGPAFIGVLKACITGLRAVDSPQAPLLPGEECLGDCNIAPSRRPDNATSSTH